MVFTKKLSNDIWVSLDVLKILLTTKILAFIHLQRRAHSNIHDTVVEVPQIYKYKQLFDVLPERHLKSICLVISSVGLNPFCRFRVKANF